VSTFLVKEEEEKEEEIKRVITWQPRIPPPIT